MTTSPDVGLIDVSWIADPILRRQTAALYLDRWGMFFDGLDFVYSLEQPMEPENPAALMHLAASDNGTALDMRPIEFSVANRLGMIEASIVKYLVQHREKRGATDLREALRYLDIGLALYFGKGSRPPHHWRRGFKWSVTPESFCDVHGVNDPERAVIVLVCRASTADHLKTAKDLIKDLLRSEYPAQPITETIESVLRDRCHQLLEVVYVAKERLAQTLDVLNKPFNAITPGERKRLATKLTRTHQLVSADVERFEREFKAGV